MLRAEDVSFGYGNGFTLLDATAAVDPGSLTGLLGPNGCGKTTLLKLLSGVLRPQQGRVFLGERPLETRQAGRLFSRLGEQLVDLLEQCGNGLWCHRCLVFDYQRLSRLRTRAARPIHRAA